jgi:hypothetical protein
MKTLTHPSLLVVDEIGFIPVSRTGAMPFLQLMSQGDGDDTEDRHG